jgi:hypothetical protein
LPRRARQEVLIVRSAAANAPDNFIDLLHPKNFHLSTLVLEGGAARFGRVPFERNRAPSKPSLGPVYLTAPSGFPEALTSPLMPYDRDALRTANLTAPKHTFGGRA